MPIGWATCVSTDTSSTTTTAYRRYRVFTARSMVMVFFTCNNCGESLKKKDVEKHCNTRCRGGPFLTCVDCLKDFREDYVKHTVCVTEDDRYSANGLKGIQTKQKSKQQQWVEVVQDTVSKTIDDGVVGLTPSIRSLMLWLQDQPTLPDKAKPFTNFIKNARRSEPPQNIEFVWKILEQARKDLQAKLTAEREAAEAERRKAKQQKLQQREESSDDDSDSSDDEKEPSSAKNGKDKSPEPEISQVKEESKKDKKKKRMVSESESVVNGSSEFRKHKKSKKNPEHEIQQENTTNLNNAMDACHLTAQNTIEEDKKLSKKEKKEKKKREKFEAEMKSMETDETAEAEENEEEQTPSEDVEEKPEGKKGKKKKNKKKNEEESSASASVEQPSEGKKKKKKNKHGAEEPMDSTEKAEKKSKNGMPENGKLNETLNMEDLEKTKFSWDQIILQVLESQSDKEISLKKLSKKVCNEYLYSLGDTCHEDEHQIMTKFQKKLHKMHNVQVLKDRVRLKTSRD
ncbi:Cell growth-regulating nucleolar protein [Frankliniella fusca]|uniref:Cell growth-regulating nucleolar protein n=1 Tax=Frankliniella fusca TaxID=407009 RepID=A0AAE1HDZ1_9NEOP|nr:Cell growth-regulating nucleolar protein [Frankliniella fusca]